MTKGHTYMQWLFTFLADTTLLTYGLQIGWISSMTEVLQSEESPIGRPITDHELSWIAGLLPISAVVGVQIYVYIADKYGRRAGVLAMAVPQALCWIIKLTSPTFSSLVIARICAGIPAGGCFNLIPIYVKEISQDSIRGKLVSLFMLLQNIGIFWMYAMGPYFDYFTVLWIVIWIPLITIIAFIKAPESPGFLVKQGKIEEAASTIALLRGLDVNEKEVQGEVDYLQEAEKQFKSLPPITYMTIFKNKTWRKGLILILLVVTTQANNGTFSIITYASTIMKSSGVTLSPELQTLSIPAIMIIGSFVIMIIVDKMGRKMILSAMFGVTTIAFICLGVSLMVLYQVGSIPSWLPVTAVILIVFASAVGIGPMPYVIMLEMFNFYIRAKVLGLIVSYGWFISFVQVTSFSYLSTLLGMENAFFLFAVNNLLGAVMTLVLLPETIGRTIEEIEDMLAKKKTKKEIDYNPE